MSCEDKGVCLEPVQRIVRVRKSHCAGSEQEDKEAQQQELSRAFGGSEVYLQRQTVEGWLVEESLLVGVDTVLSCAAPPLTINQGGWYTFCRVYRCYYFLICIN